MFSKSILSSAVMALSLAAAAAQAQWSYSEVESGPAPVFNGGLTREQVRAELARAQREGGIVYGDAEIERALLAGFVGNADRATVQVDARGAQAARGTDSADH